MTAPAIPHGKRKRLSPLERILVQRVVNGERQTEVVRELRPDIAHPNSVACRVMQRPHVLAERARLEELAIQEAGVHRVQIIRDVVSVKNRCMQAEPVLNRKGEHVLTTTPEGDLAEAYTFDSAGALKALDMLGRFAKVWGEEKGGGDTNITDNRVQIQVIRFADHPDSEQMAPALVPASAVGLSGARGEEI